MRFNISLFKRDCTELLDSQLHDEHSFFGAFSKDFKAAKSRVIIESPFLTVRRASDLQPLCDSLVKKGEV